MKYPRLLMALFVLLVMLSGCGGGGSSSSMGQQSQPQSDQPSVNANVRALPTTVNVTEIDKNTIKLDGAGISNLKQGDVIISSSGEGMLLKVAATPKMLTRDGNSMSVSITQATLEDAFQQADIKFSKTLTPSDVESVTDLSEGVTVTDAAQTPMKRGISVTKSFTLCNKVLAGTANTGVKVNGNVDLTTEVDFQIRIKRAKMEYFKCAPKTSISCSGSVSANSKLININKRILLGKINCKAIDVPVPGLSVGPVGVVIKLVPVISAYASFEGNAEIGAQWKVSSDVTLVGGVEYNNGWHPVSELSHNINIPSDFAPKVTANASGRVSMLDVDAAIMVYGVAGPYINVRAPYVEGNWTLNSDATSCVLDYKYGFDGTAGAKIEILGKNYADYSTKIFDWNKSFTGFPKTYSLVDLAAQQAAQQAASQQAAQQAAAQQAAQQAAAQQAAQQAAAQQAAQQAAAQQAAQQAAAQQAAQQAAAQQAAQQAAEQAAQQAAQHAKCYGWCGQDTLPTGIWVTTQQTAGILVIRDSPGGKKVGYLKDGERLYIDAGPVNMNFNGQNVSFYHHQRGWTAHCSTYNGSRYIYFRR